MATKTSTKTPAPEADPISAAEQEAAQTAAAAQEAAERVAALRAEQQQEADAREAAKVPLVAAWEEQERQGYAGRWRGVPEDAWQTFVAAVRDGGDAVAAWTQYRITRRLAAADRQACESWVRGQEHRQYEERLAAYKPLATEVFHLDTAISKTPNSREVLERLEQLRAAASEFTGTEIQTTSNREGAEHHREVWRAINASLHDHQPERPRPHGSNPDPRKDESFNDALRRVLLDLEDQAVRQAAADRTARRAAYVEAQLKQ
ncbi:hypothetical protein [Streptomyces sp. bgisy034]|uniref:hypothetical protein n=1 Tax=Streptomyces sp. bgisy034 TaxID=3413774 RepID=UPI003EB78A5F